MSMYNKVIQFVNPETGIVAVVHMPAVINLPGGSTIEVTDATLQAEAVKVVPGGVPYQIVDRSSVPVDRTFRNAWALDGQTIKGDVEKAKAIVLERKRKVRDELLLEQDKLEQIATRQGGDLTAIHAEKNRLCSCTDCVKAYVCSEGSVASLETLAAELLPLEGV